MSDSRALTDLGLEQLEASSSIASTDKMIIVKAGTSEPKLADINAIAEESAEGIMAVHGQATIAEINAGLTLIDNPSATKGIAILGFSVFVTGNFADVTAVTIGDGTAVAASFAQAQLTDTANLYPGATGVTTSYLGVKLSIGEDIVMRKTGSDITGATGLEYSLIYKLI